MASSVYDLQTTLEKSNDNDAIVSSRLGKCEVCNAKDARYTCPKCELKTCSLPCVQIHKKELDCDGKRDRTKFVPARSMSNMDFMSDYYFLEECTRYVEDRKSDNIKRFTRYNRQLPTHLHRLRAAAHERGTNLMYLLQNFTRHKKNTTYYDWNEKRIYWRIEWIFANAGERKYVDERCAEDATLAKLLERYLNAEQAALQNVPERKELAFYQAKGAYGIKILLKAEYIKQCKKRFYELDPSLTLKQNLKGKFLVEFPTIFLFCDNTDDLDIIDSDEDVAVETKAFLESLDNFRREQYIKAKKAAEAGDAGSDDDEKQPAPSNVENKNSKRAKLENKPKNFFFDGDSEISSSSDEDNKII